MKGHRAAGLWLAGVFAALAAGTARAQGSSSTPEDSLVAVSADVVEITGNLQNQTGFSWAPFEAGVNFAEKAIPGIYKFGDFARQTALQTALRFLETEGKAQTLSNPKVVIQAGSQADFVVGGSFPIPICNNQGCSAQQQQFGVVLKVAPAINPNKKDTIRAEMQLEVTDPDFSRTIVIGNASVPSLNTRQIQTTVEVKSGETLVLGGFKSSSKGITKTRVPYLGKIPLLGLLFTTKNVVENQKSLFLFITMEVVK